MLKDLQVTLYEIFGYVMPGGIVTAALAVIFLAIYLPTDHISFDLPTTEVWLTVLALAYFAGHMGQAVANLLVKLAKWDEAKAVQQLPPEIRSRVVERLKTVVGEKAAELSERWQFEVCDDAVIRSGKRGEREVYVYSRTLVPASGTTPANP